MNEYLYQNKLGPDEILDKLYLGSITEARDKKTLKELNVTHILVTASFINNSYDVRSL